MRQCLVPKMRQYLIFGYQYLMLGDGALIKRSELLCFKQFYSLQCHLLKKVFLYI